MNRIQYWAHKTNSIACKQVELKKPFRHDIIDTFGVIISTIPAITINGIRFVSPMRYVVRVFCLLAFCSMPLFPIVSVSCHLHLIGFSWLWIKAKLLLHISIECAFIWYEAWTNASIVHTHSHISHWTRKLNLPKEKAHCTVAQYMLEMRNYRVE